jgi:phosphatidylinositol glycan class W
MDLGTASFTMAAGLTSRYARRSSSPAFSSPLLKSAPVLLLGLVRLATTKGLEYQEHVSEYGVHWNFFFTLAAVSVGVGLLGKLPRKAVVTLVALGMAAYQ